MNEFQQWWVTHLAQETKKAHQRAERLYPIRILSNKAKRDMFMDTFHWTMLEQRITIEKLFQQPVTLKKPDRRAQNLKTTQTVPQQIN